MKLPDLYTLTHRDSFGHWLNSEGLLGDGVEVGSAFGQFATQIAGQWKGRSLAMIDPWENLPKEEYRENHEAVDYIQWHRICQDLAARDNRLRLIKARSMDAVKEFENLSLDWVYIDGNHDYGFVLQDLDAWYNKVKTGGVLCGHDFYNNFEGGNWCGVADAVLRWMRERHFVFTVTPCTSWWSVKI